MPLLRWRQRRGIRDYRAEIMEASSHLIYRAAVVMSLCARPACGLRGLSERLAKDASDLNRADRIVTLQIRSGADEIVGAAADESLDTLIGDTKQRQDALCQAPIEV